MLSLNVLPITQELRHWFSADLLPELAKQGFWNAAGIMSRHKAEMDDVFRNMPRSTEQIQQYRSFIENAFLQEKNESCFVQDPETAAIITEISLQRASKHVEILSDDLDQRIWGTKGVIAAAIDFLKRENDSKLDIIARQEIDFVSHPLMAAIRKSGSVKLPEIALMSPEAGREYQFDFMVTDRKHFRYQKSHLSVSSFCQFHQTVMAKKISDVFSIIKARCQPVPMHTPASRMPSPEGLATQPL